MSDKLTVRIKGGYLVAEKSTDPDYPGIDIEFIPDTDNGKTFPRVLVEGPPEHSDENYPNLRTLVWADPDSEDYSHCIDF